MGRGALRLSHLTYLPPVQQVTAQHGAAKYVGAVAAGYDAKRENTEKFIVEQGIIERMLGDLPSGTRVLDCPVGTGRFLPYYVERDFIFIGMDRSMDMMTIAATKVKSQKARGELHVGNILATNLADKAVDVTVNCRITRWVIGEHGPSGIAAMLKEMQRVTLERIILTARVRDHKYAVTRDLIESALDGWVIHEDAEGYEPAYRIMELRPA